MADKKKTRQEMEAEGYPVYWVDNLDGTYSERVVASGGGGAASTVAISQTGTQNDVDVVSVVPGTGATNLGKAIDGAAGAVDVGVAPLAVRDDALGTLTPAEGDWVPLRLDSNGALWVRLADATVSATDLDIRNLAATQDDVVTYQATDAIYEGNSALTPKFAFANIAASQTDAALVAAVASKKIRVLALVMVTGGTATNVTFTSKPAGAGAAKSPLFANAANGGVVLPFNPVGWFETVVDEGLSVTTAAGSTTGIQVVYVEAA